MVQVGAYLFQSPFAMFRNNCTQQIALKQECIPVGCVPSAMAAVSGGVGASRGGASRGGVLPGGVVSQHALRQTPPPVNRMTDRCKNITFTTSLRTVTRRPFSQRPTTRLPIDKDVNRLTDTHDLKHYLPELHFAR